MFTSCLPHLDLLHLVFNLYWLYYFGTQIEVVFGHAKIAGLYLLLGVVSSAVEYAFTGSGVGLSGIGYGLFGMLWVLSRSDDRFADALPGNTIGLFVVWFFLCIAMTATGGWSVGNFAHGTGAMMGFLVGYAVSAKEPSQQKMRSIAIAALVVVLLPTLHFARPYINRTESVLHENLRLAHALIDQNAADQAIPILQQTVERDPRSDMAWEHLGYAYHTVARFPEAIEAYQKVMELEPQPRVRGVLANLMSYLAYKKHVGGDNKAAVRLYRESLAMEDKQASVWANLGNALAATEDRAGALDAFQRAIELDPTEPAYREGRKALQPIEDEGG